MQVIKEGEQQLQVSRLPIYGYHFLTRIVRLEKSDCYYCHYCVVSVYMVVVQQGLDSMYATMGDETSKLTPPTGCPVMLKPSECKIVLEGSSGQRDHFVVQVAAPFDIEEVKQRIMILVQEPLDSRPSSDGDIAAEEENVGCSVPHLDTSRLRSSSIRSGECGSGEDRVFRKKRSVQGLATHIIHESRVVA